MTAIFTPGYAAAEQFTSAKQGPWTDIYGLSATLYHAITGQMPPSAFERMLNDTYEPLGQLDAGGLSRGLLAGIDAGLAVAAPRPAAEHRRLAADPRHDVGARCGRRNGRHGQDGGGATRRAAGWGGPMTISTLPPPAAADRAAPACGSASPSCCLPC